jgi:hypothetical protein
VYCRLGPIPTQENVSVPIRLCVSALILVAFSATGVAAQSSADRVAGSTWGFPLVLNRVDGQTIATLGFAASIPMGFETAGPTAFTFLEIAATGKTVREALDALTAADPRYTWRDDDGVILVHPRLNNPVESLLNSQVGPLRLDGIDAQDAFVLLRRLLGLPGDFVSGPGDTKRFSVDVSEGSTLRQLLNAIVHAHGSLAWAIQETTVPPPAGLSGYSLLLYAGPSGIGVGIPDHGLVPRPQTDTLNLARATDAQLPLLERLVGKDTVSGQPLVLYGVKSLFSLARAVGAPMGMQTLPAEDRDHRQVHGLTVTGLQLRTALDALATMDGRYEWRVVDEVVVFRPKGAWTDPRDPLFRPVPGFQLNDVPVAKAIGFLMPYVAAPERAATMQFEDSRRPSIDLASGTVLDVLNGIVRAHGAMVWHWEELTEAQQQEWRAVGARRMLHFNLFRGPGKGFAIP